MAESRRPARRTTQRSSQGRPATRSTAPSSGRRPQTSSDQRRRSSSSQRSRGTAASAQRTRKTTRQGGRSVPQNTMRRSAPRRNARREGSQLPLIGLAILLAVGLIAFGVHLVRNPKHFNVSINGETYRMTRGDTLATVIEKGYTSPKAGNLLAVDGSLITEGGGDPFEATVNGTATIDPETRLTKKAVVEMSDGNDVTEKFSATEQTVPHGQGSSSTDMGAYWFGSLHVYVQGEDGLRTTKTGEVSGITVVEDTKPAVDAGYTIYSAKPAEEKVIALTFDDGPWPDTTDAILDILEENGAKATFFTIGNQVVEYPEQVKREQALGCQVATHTWDHADGSGQGVNLTYMSSQEQIDEVQRGYQAITQVLGTEPSHILRAPGGNYYGDIIQTLEPYVHAEIGWDVDTKDWSLPGSDAIYEAIMSAKSGNVILMHDGGGNREQTVEAVRRAVPALKEQGYTFVTIDELLEKYPPSTAQSGDTFVVN